MYKTELLDKSKIIIMNSRIILITTLIFLTTFQYSKSQTFTDSIRLGPATGEDCLLTSVYPDIPFPESNDIISFAWTFSSEFGIGRSVFKYNLSFIPTNAVIKSARLSLFGNYYSGNNYHSGKNTTYIRRVTTPWNPLTATWETQPDYSTVNQVTLKQSTLPYQDYTDIDVTKLVSQMVSEPLNNYGFMLILKTEAKFRCMNFSSGDCPNISKRPLLVITYNIVTGISQSNISIPSKYEVCQNFPNPFNPLTKIKFDIPKSTYIRLTVFDEMGREVNSLVNENLNAGSYEVEWDGINNNSGIYFYRMQTDNYTETKKMILIK